MRAFQVRIVAWVGLLAIFVARVPAAAQEASPAAARSGAPCAIAGGTVGSGAACVNLVHAWSGRGAVDVYLDGEMMFATLAFGTSSGLIAVLAGPHEILVTEAGKGVSREVVAPTSIDAPAGSVQEVVLVAESGDGFLFTSAVDLSPLGIGLFRVHVLDAVQDTPAVDLAVVDGAVWAPDLTFSMVSLPLELPAGQYSLEVRPAGTTDVALPAPSLQFDANTVQSLYLIGSLMDGTLRLLPVVTPLN